MQTIEREFTQRFKEIWKHPSPDQLVTLLHPDIILFQPHLRPIQGKDAALEEFQRLFNWMPDLYGEVDNFCGSDDVVFIQWRMIFPFGKKPLSVAMVDRFILQEGLAVERVAYFNFLRIIGAIILNPSTWLGYVNYYLRSSLR